MLCFVFLQIYLDKKAQITQDIKWCYIDGKFETQPSKTHVTCTTIYNFDLSYLKPLKRNFYDLPGIQTCSVIFQRRIAIYSVDAYYFMFSYNVFF